MARLRASDDDLAGDRNPHMRLKVALRGTSTDPIVKRCVEPVAAQHSLRGNALVNAYDPREPPGGRLHGPYTVLGRIF